MKIQKIKGHESFALSYFIRVLTVIIICGGLCGIFTSCSGEYHLRKAYEKGALHNDTIYQNTSDTVYRFDTGFKFIEIPREVTVVKDSIYCDSNNLPVLVRQIAGKDSTQNIQVIRELNGNILKITAEREEQQLKIKQLTKQLTVITNQNKQLTKVNSRLKERLDAKGYSFTEAIGVGILIILAFVVLGIIIKRKTWT